MGVWSLSGEDSLEWEMTTYSSILDWRIHGQRSLVGYNPWGLTDSDMTEAINMHARSWAWDPNPRGLWTYKEERDLSLCPSCGNMLEGSWESSQLKMIQLSPLIWNFPISWTVRHKCLLFNLPSLWCSVMAAPAYEDSKVPSPSDGPFSWEMASRALIQSWASFCFLSTKRDTRKVSSAYRRV